MSETAQTLVESALRVIGVIAPGETPTADELTDGLQALKFMLRHWSDKNIRLYYVVIESISLTGATSYSWGTTGTIATARPANLLSADDGSDGIELVDRERYERLVLANTDTGTIHFWYNPTFPNGTLYVYPASTATANVRSMKALSEPSLIGSDVTFPPGYDEAIKWNLALRLAPEYGVEPSGIVASMAASALHDIEVDNFANSMVTARPEILKIVESYDITEG